MKVIQLKPIFQERVWGGRDLQTTLNKDLPEGKVIGESWEIVDRAEADSAVIGSNAGLSLGQIRQEDTAFLMGPDWPSDKPFPILVKWLDCQERLSLQVHPPASIAPELKGEPKTENWYIAKRAPGAGLLAGLKQGVTRDQFEAALRADELEPLVHRLEVEEGDSLFVESGRLHAIDAGNLILEIQQNSDTTYRVYDWGRVGLDGQPRQLHIEESLKSIDFEDFEPEILRPSGKECLLADSQEFRLRKLTLEAGETVAFGEGEEPRILSIVSGVLEESEGIVLSSGSNSILPYGASTDWTAKEATELLVTDRFNSAS